jgi:hypothetical protein
MESVLQRGEKLDDLVDRSQALSMQSKMFYKTAKKVRTLSKNYLCSSLMIFSAKLLLLRHVKSYRHCISYITLNDSECTLSYPFVSAPSPATSGITSTMYLYHIGLIYIHSCYGCNAKMAGTCNTVCFLYNSPAMRVMHTDKVIVLWVHQ